MLKLENIVAGYGHITALKDVSLEVPQGSVVSLIGAYGASTFRDAVAFGLIILLLFWRPQGLFGSKDKGGRP